MEGRIRSRHIVISIEWPLGGYHLSSEGSYLSLLELIQVKQQTALDGKDVKMLLSL